MCDHSTAVLVDTPVRLLFERLLDTVGPNGNCTATSKPFDDYDLGHELTDSTDSGTEVPKNGSFGVAHLAFDGELSLHVDVGAYSSTNLTPIRIHHTQHIRSYQFRSRYSTRWEIYIRGTQYMSTVVET